MANEISQPPIGIVAPDQLPQEQIIPEQVAAPQVENIGQDLANTAQVIQPSPQEDFAKEAAYQAQLAELNGEAINPQHAAQIGEQKALDTVAAANQQAQAEAIQRQAAAAQAYEAEKSQADQMNQKRALVGLAPLPVPAKPFSAGELSTQAQGPIITDEDLANLPDAVQKALTAPNPADVIRQVEERSEPIRAARTEQFALDKMAAEEQKMLERQQLRETEVEKQVAEIDKRVRQKSLNEIMQGDSLGAKLGAAFAVMLGGVSQGLTGAKSNPVLDYMNNVVEKQAAKDKLNLDEKEALRANVYRQGQEELKKLDSKSLNAFHRDQLMLESQKLADAENAILAKLNASVAAQKPQDIYSGRELSPQEALYARQNIPDQVVVLPDGSNRTFLATNKEDANKFKDLAAPTYDALGKIKLLQELSKKGSSFSPTDRKRANVLKDAIVGALRLPFTGPGILTDSERAMLADTLGNPLAIFAVKDWENSKLKQVEDVLKAGITSTARARGINGEIFNDFKAYNVKGKAVKEDDLVRAYMQKSPGVSEEKIRMFIQKSIPAI